MTIQHEPETFLFTSESVGEGHPDKICDQIADAILDECLRHDPLSKVAIEVAVRPGLVIVFGVVDSLACLDVDGIVREVLRDIGYDSPDQELDYRTCDVMDYVEVRSVKKLPNSNGNGNGNGALVSGSFPSRAEKEVAGDQGMVFGYATDETPQLLPLTIDLAHRISRALKAACIEGTLPWLRPDTKVQVTAEYKQEGGHIAPLRVHTVVVTAQHTPDVTVDELRGAIREMVVLKSIPAMYLDARTVYHIQPTGDVGVTPSGKFAGVTGRKIVVDTYGGWGAHGGGAFSGKDFRQVDRSAAYMARWIAKSLVHAGLAQRCLIQLSYSSGIAEPLSIFIDTFGTSQVSVERLKQIVRMNFDLRPAGIAMELGLMSPIYYATAKNGHFTSGLFPWERVRELVL
ncbi:methionine adenosyltransferase [Aspergillus mulundensis]|uniref:S-adenosylmethionine synthase n=1 Tax=Aspergillus mulundensis TaxID=1810919 RepID=A0A3D8RXT6_9EURO|nr:S-adenosylmethionine synthase [Aspergillus mulundensis]RDW78877.1 S-adenosylmethionine synthase [Aspergillus mulundensis]